MNIAKKLIDEASQAGVDVVKFQAFIAEEEISRYSPKAAYQVETTGAEGGQLEMAKKLELTHDQLRDIYRYCEEKSIPFLCSAFDDISFDFLLNDLKVKSVKIASSEVTNHPFLARIAKSGVGIILSTGASSIEEVEQAVNVIKHSGDVELVLLHCVSNYPADKNQLNLKAVSTMKQRFGLPIGYSDHSEGVLAPIVAMCFGAIAIEKHFTLDRTMQGPDHRASIEPDEMAMLVSGVREAHGMMGNGNKQCMGCEQDNQNLIRKSIVAAHPLPAGHIVSESDVRFKRPDNGLEPFRLNEILGKTLGASIDVDQPLAYDHFTA